MNLLPVLIAGLAGSVHCAGMCGGIVSAFSVGGPSAAPVRARVIPIVRAGAVTGPSMSALPLATGGAAAAGAIGHVLSYNAGRIGSYMLAGAIAGGFAGSVASLAHMASAQQAAHVLANLMLAVMGLYLMDAWRGLARVEQAGGVLWRRVQPLVKPLVPMDTPLKALALGGLWGWVPCGMVYSMLLTAMLSGSALDGALVMGAFGLGTLPMLLAMGMAGAKLRQYLQQRSVRIACGFVVLGFGALGLARAAGGGQHAWLDVLCLTVQP
ncbi:sulfite exporter TauE/SafE family protein [Pseudoduganella eburnea]|uniref:Sulfite exporter TauE/SafE family protein n=1 Tax=Massilia eburnea TaxID=1776165 RepID=A0A6L6QI99_9BURK|nr:sulfite exporter TauE/SafE family protein [Massilia eburnea]MTW11979.1 sulfite exporter TauE/SafE family protein [Massilia eburnea]